jgi:hypothetical protein
MTACLRNPVPSLSADNFLSRGAGGQVFIISQRVVFKCPTIFDNPAPEQAEEMGEKFALASCIYAIRFGHVPFHEIDAPDRVQRLIKGEFPPTTKDALFGDVTKRCWMGEYVAITAVGKDVGSRFEGGSGTLTGVCDEASEPLLAECEEFLAREEVNSKGG